MEEKKSNGISASAFFLIIAIIVIIAMGYFIYKFYNDKTNETKRADDLQAQVNSLNGSVNELQEKNNSDENLEFTSIIDSKEDSRKINMYGTEEEINIKWELLQVNFDSEDAKAVNMKLKENYEKAINSISSTDIFVEYTSIDYEVSCSNGILSILVTVEDNPIPGGDTVPTYEVYNFDINTQKMMNVDEALEKVGLSREEFDNRFKKKIEQHYTAMTSSKYKIDESNYGSSFEEYYSKFDFEDLKCFIYSSKKMKVIYKGPSEYGIINMEEDFEYNLLY